MKKKYAVMCVPKSGLFYSRGRFHSGDDAIVTHKMTYSIRFYSNLKLARTNKKRMAEEYRTRFVIVEFLERVGGAK